MCLPSEVYILSIGVGFMNHVECMMKYGIDYVFSNHRQRQRTRTMLKEVAGRKPTRKELIMRDPTAVLMYRKPRSYKDKHGHVKYDSPKDQSASGKMLVALGMSALGFASVCIRRVRVEKQIIHQMWKANTTIAGLRAQAAAGKPLPKTVLIRGQIKARGEPVRSLAVQVPELRPLMGVVDQPRNFYLDQAAGISLGRSREIPASYGKLGRDIENGADDFNQRQAVLGSNLVISELLITRLGCEARIETSKDKDGNVTRKVKRHPRAARFNVFQHLQVAEGLHLVGSDGESADLILPVYGENELRKGDPPALFLTLPDPINEFKRFAHGVWWIINSDKPFTHLSHFIHLDQRSDTDDGSFNSRVKASTSKNVRDTIKNTLDKAPTSENAPDTVENALDSIGRLMPNGWLWSGKGFYDNRPGSWASYPDVEVVDYDTFRRRIGVASQENGRHQEAVDDDGSSLDSTRDRDNCFRVVELGVPADSDVVVLGKPQLLLGQDVGRSSSGGSSLAICPPEAHPDRNIADARFLFRILKGHTVDNLVKHRNASMLVYLGFASMAAATVYVGEEKIRDSLEVQYS
jgi:hypothetical protein